MVRVTVAAAACLAGVAVAQEIPIKDQAWDDFKKKFNKKYESKEQEAKRRGVFESTMQYIEKSNANKENTFKLGLNQFSDLLVDEWSSAYFGMKPPTAAMYGNAPYLGRHEVANVTLPASVDWSTKGAVTAIKNQGQCGSCWSFSATGAMEGAYEIANGKLISLSEQQLVDCGSSFGEQGCNGGLMDGAFGYAQKNGMCTETDYPYDAKSGKCQASSCTKAWGPDTVSGYKDVSTDDKMALMSAVAQQPVSIAIEADKMVFQSYQSGVLTGMCGSKLDHGVLVVGYGTLDGEDYWKVKNSWGETWGMEGYVLLKRGKTGAGECGILSQPSYPVVKKAAAEMVVV